MTVTPPHRYQLSHPATLPDEMIPPHRGAVSIWTHVKRTGDWILPRTFRAIALMGGVEIDLRNARVAAGTSTIDLRCMWGGVTIFIPDDMQVDCDVDALAAGVDVVYTVPSRAGADAPRIRIIGTVLMGGVEVKVVPREG